MQLGSVLEPVVVADRYVGRGSPDAPALRGYAALTERERHAVASRSARAGYPLRTQVGEVRPRPSVVRSRTRSVAPGLRRARWNSAISRARGPAWTLHWGGASPRKDPMMTTLDLDTLTQVTGGVTSSSSSSSTAALTQSLATIQSSISNLTNNPSNNQNNMLLPMAMMMAMNRRQSSVISAGGATVVS